MVTFKNPQHTNKFLEDYVSRMVIPLQREGRPIENEAEAVFLAFLHRHLQTSSPSDGQVISDKAESR
jgi:hypothetical protein